MGAVSGGERQSPGLQTKFLGGGWARRWWEVGALGKAGNVLKTTPPPLPALSVAIDQNLGFSFAKYA